MEPMEPPLDPPLFIASMFFFCAHSIITKCSFACGPSEQVYGVINTYQGAPIIVKHGKTLNVST